MVRLAGPVWPAIRPGLAPWQPKMGAAASAIAPRAQCCTNSLRDTGPVCCGVVLMLSAQRTKRQAGRQRATSGFRLISPDRKSTPSNAEAKTGLNDAAFAPYPLTDGRHQLPRHQKLSPPALPGRPPPLLLNSPWATGPALNKPLLSAK